MGIRQLFDRGGAAMPPETSSEAPDRAAFSDAKRLRLLNEFEEAELGWFWATDPQGNLTYLSASAMRNLGFAKGDVIGKPLSELFASDTFNEEEGESQRPLPFLLRAQNTIANLTVKVAHEDRELWWELSGKPQFEEDRQFVGYRGSAKDISARRQGERDTARMAKYDALTGLANRHWMEGRLSSILTAYKASKKSCALVMLDLDRFKQVNDTLGHPAGDELLKQVAQRLERLVGELGTIGRLGGDEFQIILPDIEDRGRLGDLSQRIIQMISQPYSINGSRAIIGTSVGVAIAPYDGIEAAELVKAADLALYAAKGGGRGQYRFYSSDLQDGARRSRRIEEDLRDALAADELEMHYQPLVDPGTNKVRSFEALVRWNHEEIGWISPAEFIPIAEESNQIIELGAWVMRRACRDAASWPGELCVAVNVSAIQFGNAELPVMVKDALISSGLEPSRLEIELTESVFIGDPQATRDMFAELKQLGLKLALDDFGTGYSSLGYLRDAPFDKIKIDQSFVRGACDEDSNNAALITAIVSLADALGMVTVAEGVEAQDELALIGDLGVTLVQGWIFSKALAQDDVLAKLQNGELEFRPVGPARSRAERKAMYRKVGVIHEDHRYEVVMRNLSRSGARIEGLLGVPEGTDLVLDLGQGQMVVAKVRRSHDAEQGLEFETKLISDGADGLCTRHRISPYALAAAGMPLAALPEGDYPLTQAMLGQPKGRPAFMQVDLSASKG